MVCSMLLCVHASSIRLLPVLPACWPNVSIEARSGCPANWMMFIAESKHNSCSLVWQGVVHGKVFQRFDMELCRTEAAAKTFLKLKGLEHYWDLAKGHVNE